MQGTPALLRSVTRQLRRRFGAEATVLVAEDDELVSLRPAFGSVVDALRATETATCPARVDFAVDASARLLDVGVGVLGRRQRQLVARGKRSDLKAPHGDGGKASLQMLRAPDGKYLPASAVSLRARTLQARRQSHDSTASSTAILSSPLTAIQREFDLQTGSAALSADGGALQRLMGEATLNSSSLKSLLDSTVANALHEVFSMGFGVASRA
jgi:hypothetical protein